ncbi:MAG TPA: phosphatidate cytidylyltransferase [Acidiferrobacteraceae bacterium]|nr:phosphatidate cytidylyltransferase [Acidiferrobacteraceae bacterium]
MLKARIITAIVMAVVLFGVLFGLSGGAFAAVLGLVVLGGAWEWSRLAGLIRIEFRLLYSTIIAAIGVVCYRYAFPEVWPLLVGVGWWFAIVVLLFRLQTRGIQLQSRAFVLIAGVVVLVPAWYAAVMLHAIDLKRPWLLLSLFLVIWGADIAAYFAGKARGRIRLASRLSPGKTVEGLSGGLAGVLLVAVFLGATVWQLGATTLLMWVSLCLASGLFSVVGDLFESVIKRQAGAKDSGNLLPGHGGILDRIDSFTAAAPIFALGWLLLKGL